MSLYSVPARPYAIEFSQPDGSKINIFVKGDEHAKWAETVDGYSLLYNTKGYYEYATQNSDGEMVCSGVVAKNKIHRSSEEVSFLSGIKKEIRYTKSQVSYLKSISQIYKTEAQKAFPTTGSHKLVCILMGYSDLAFTKTNTDFQNLFNQVGYTEDGATGSVKDFYNEDSYNKFDLTVTVAGPYTAAKTMAYYGGNNTSGDDSNPRELITEAVKKADADVNYADFDNDTDGVVDGVYVIFAGYGEEAGASANAIWSHSWSISSLTLDGKTISSYACSPELRSTSGTGITRIGVICHEFGHVLGAPDFYDTDYDTNGQFVGTGDWDLMSNGSWNNDGATPAHHNGYTKTQIYNWATATALSSATHITMRSTVESSASYYRINTTTANEFFVLENRQLEGFDAGLPGHGLIIYHVNSNIASHFDNNDLNATYPQMMYPVCASASTNPGSLPTTYGYVSSAGCPFPGTYSKTSFTDATTPYAKSWAGGKTNKPITNITENTTDHTIMFDFMGGDNYAPASFTASTVNSSQITLNWTQNTNNDDVMIAVNTTENFGDPTNGTAYSVGSTIFGGGTIIYAGSDLLFDHLNLNLGTLYYYKAWSIKTGNEYSSGIKAQATTTFKNFSLPFNEDFEGTTFSPNGWVNYRGKNNLGAVNDWERVSGGNNASEGAAYINYEEVTVDSVAQDWLVTPNLIIPDGCKARLSYFEKQENSGKDSSRYSIKVSTSSQSILDSFKTVKSYNQTSLPWSTYTKRSVDLSQFAGQNIYIAFVLQQNNGHDWYIDDVNVADTTITYGQWTGITSDNWGTSTNWMGNAIPNQLVDVTIPAACANYPSINTNAICKSIQVNDGASLTINTGANLSVENHITIGNGSTGIFAVIGGACTASGNFYSDLGSKIDISGGSLNFTNWYANTNDSNAKGTIILSGGMINASNDIRFASENLTGTVNGPVEISVGGSLYFGSTAWSTITNGSINLRGTGTSPYLFCPPTNSSSIEVYDLNVIAQDRTYYLTNADTCTLTVKNNFTITSGNIQTYNGNYPVKNLNIAGNLSIGSDGGLICGKTSINLSGNWDKATTGVFTARSSTVVLKGTNQSIKGTNTFYNLTKVGSGTDTLTFGEGTTNKTYVSGILTLQGTAGQLLSLRSATDGTQWMIDPQSTRVIGYLDVKDSKNSNATLINACNSNSINSGNNYSWNFCTTSVDDVTSENASSGYTIYPNPAKDFITIESKSEGKTSLSVFSIDNKLRDTKILYDKVSIIDISELANGIYILKLDHAKSTTTLKLVKQ